MRQPPAETVRPEGVAMGTGERGADLGRSRLPLPPCHRPEWTEQVARVPYQELAIAAAAWRDQYAIAPADRDDHRLVLLAIDVQNTFCLPDFELFVGGRSGRGAIDDSRRLCEFVYHNLPHLTAIVPTLDTHGALQIFHPHFWCDRDGNPPAPMTQIDAAAVESGQWQVNPAIAAALGTTPDDLARHGLHYVKTLEQAGKFPLTIWPYHSMLGGVGHALVAAFEAACFFHAIARHSPTRFDLKGDHPLTEHYSALGPEVAIAADGAPLGLANKRLLDYLLEFDAIAIAGQAKSHCVAWTIADLLARIQAIDPALAGRVYLLEDCMSPVVVPGIVDFSDAAEAAFAQFAAAGMHRVRSTDPPETWPGWGDR
ncbi:MAG: isochorismatase [Cyanobacteria bacterium]|nr:isochorismatase [Cyanobacteriota bacterium]